MFSHSNSVIFLFVSVRPGEFLDVKKLKWKTYGFQKGTVKSTDRNRLEETFTSLFLDAYDDSVIVTTR